MHTLEISNIHSHIEAMFPLDKDLSDKYHVSSGSNVQACIERTKFDLSFVDKSNKFYVLYNGDEEIGFFGKEFDNYLNTLFIVPAYRNKEIMPAIWNTIKSSFTKPFYTALYSKNNRAIEFYKKNGGSVEKTFSFCNEPAVMIRFEE